jgi:hypothetical protein
MEGLRANIPVCDYCGLQPLPVQALKQPDVTAVLVFEMVLKYHPTLPAVFACRIPVF